MGQTNKPLATLLALCTLTASGLAQVRGTPASPAPVTTPADEDAVPTMPDIKDPMLEPVPPAAKTLGSWREALLLVRNRSTALHISRAQVDETRATTERARSGSLPNLDVNAGVTRYLLLGNSSTSAAFTGGAQALITGSLPSPPTQVVGGLSLTQPLINFGAWYSVGTAKEHERAAEQTALDTQRQLLGTVAQAAVGVITASRIAESSRVSLASALSTLDLTRRRAELGAASAVDTLRAEQEVASSRAQIVSGDESLLQARETLGAAMGESVGWGVAPDIRVEDLERTASSVCQVVDPMEARADVRAAEKNVVAADRERKSVDYMFAPTLNLVSNLGYTNWAFASVNGEHLSWSVGGQLGWTLYDGGDRYGQRHFNEAALTIAKETLTQKKRDVTLQVVQADRGIVVAQANFVVATSARDVAKEQARLSRLAFVNGSGTSFDLVDSARQLRQAEIDLLIKDFQVFQARLTAFLARANCAI